MFNNVDDVCRKVNIKVTMCIHGQPSDVPPGPLDTNVVPGHLIFQCHMLQLTRYRRSGFYCEYLLNVNCEVLKGSQSIDSQEWAYTMNRFAEHWSRDDATLITSKQLYVDKMSPHRYFWPSTNMPTSSQTQLAPNVLREVNQTVAAALQREEEGTQSQWRVKKRKYMTWRHLHLKIALR